MTRPYSDIGVLQFRQDVDAAIGRPAPNREPRATAPWRPNCPPPDNYDECIRPVLDFAGTISEANAQLLSAIDDLPMEGIEQTLKGMEAFEQ